MKVMALGGVGVVCCGAYLATAGGPIEREVGKPPSAVYAAFASMAHSEGPSVIHGNNPYMSAKMTLEKRVTKKPGEAIDVSLLVNGKPAVTIAMRFAPLDEGRRTRLTAEASMDRKLLETEGGMVTDAPPGLERAALPILVGQAIDARIDMLNRGIAPPADLMGGLMRRNGPSDAMVARPRRHEERLRAASAPTASAQPMLDPTAVARRHQYGE